VTEGPETAEQLLPIPPLALFSVSGPENVIPPVGFRSIVDDEEAALDVEQLPAPLKLAPAWVGPRGFDSCDELLQLLAFAICMGAIGIIDTTAITIRAPNTNLSLLTYSHSKFEY
jgi:hypothetical protein